jgi:hypothetical protein
VNTAKHPNRETVFCPFCRREHVNRWYDRTWKPNAKWHQHRHRSRPFTVADMRRAIRVVVQTLGRIRVVRPPDTPKTAEDVLS